AIAQWGQTDHGRLGTSAKKTQRTARKAHQASVTVRSTAGAGIRLRKSRDSIIRRTFRRRANSSSQTGSRRSPPGAAALARRTIRVRERTNDVQWRRGVPLTILSALQVYPRENA